MARNFAMVIDLHRCVGCAACDIACKSENNVPEGFHWSNHIIETRGTFPDVNYRYIPVLCNHCENAPCVQVCPTTAMHKDADGITMHDADKCIGCVACQLACPYGVIWFNKEAPHQRWSETSTAIEGATASAAETAREAGTPVPYYNPDRARTYDGVRRRGIVEKCTFCDHRVKDGHQPWCVIACPADARIFGDLNDPSSSVNSLLARHDPKVLRREQGTRPKVFYIRDY